MFFPLSFTNSPMSSSRVWWLTFFSVVSLSALCELFDWCLVSMSVSSLCYLFAIPLNVQKSEIYIDPCPLSWLLYSFIAIVNFVIVWNHILRIYIYKLNKHRNSTTWSVNFSYTKDCMSLHRNFLLLLKKDKLWLSRLSMLDFNATCLRRYW